MILYFHLIQQIMRPRAKMKSSIFKLQYLDRLESFVNIMF